VFWPFRRKRAPPPQEEGPLAAYDRAVAELERQSAQVRRSAATLLSLKGELSRQLEEAERQERAVAEKLAIARQRRDSRAESVLTEDHGTARTRAAQARQLSASASEDAQVLTEAAKELGRELQSLLAEREEARLRLAAGHALVGALKERHLGIRQTLALDAARDEVELAHQLARVYLEDRRSRG
jgi:hypothetical protein